MNVEARLRDQPVVTVRDSIPIRSMMNNYRSPISVLPNPIRVEILANKLRNYLNNYLRI